MKIRIELDELLQEEEVIIRCPILTEKVQKIQKILFETYNSSDKMILFKNVLLKKPLKVNKQKK